MHILVILGGPGAGKTTLIKRSIRMLLERFPTVVWLFNDDGSPKKTDAFRALRPLKGLYFRPLLGGCLGCDDNSRQLKQLCEEAEHELHADLVIIETYGFVGDDVVGKLRSFGYAPHVFTLLNVEKLTPVHDLSLVVNGTPVIHDQLAAANLGIGLTKYQHVPPPQSQIADELAGEFAPGMVRVELPPGAQFPNVLLDGLELPPPPARTRFKRQPAARRGLMLLQQHGHAHASSNRTFDLRPGIKYEDVQHWAAALPNVHRIKGTIGELVVDYDGLNWDVRKRKSCRAHPPGTLTLYYKGKCPDYAWMTDVSVEQAFLRQHVERVEYWLEQAPTGTLFLSDGRVVTHPTPITQAIVLCEQRADTPPELMARAIRTHVAYAVQAAERVLCPGQPEWEDPRQRDSMRAIVITVAWYADQQPDLGEALLARVRALSHLPEMFNRGLQGMTSAFFHADAAKAVEYAKDLHPVFRWIGGREQVKEGMGHVLDLIRREDPPRPELLVAWQAL